MGNSSSLQPLGDKIALVLNIGEGDILGALFQGAESHCLWLNAF